MQVFPIHLNEGSVLALVWLETGAPEKEGS